METFRPLNTHAPNLLALGYPIIPIKAGAKHPGIKGWQMLEATPTLLQQWQETDWLAGVGVKTTNFPAIDLDIQDSELVGKAIDYCLKEIGPTPLRRVGKPPKVLLVYRTDKPFKKMASKKYKSPDGKTHQIEILGDGQQFVAYGIHPSTERPYEWTASELVDVKPDSLPVLAQVDCRNLIKWFERQAEAREWEVVENGKRGGATKGDGALDPLETAKPVCGLSLDEIRETISKIDPNPYDDWVKVGMAIHHETDGQLDGMAIWDGWSSYGEKYDAKEIGEKWTSFEVNLTRHEPVTMRSILKLAKNEAGDLTLKQKAEKQAVDGNSLEGFLKRYVFIETGNLVADLSRPANEGISKLDEFKNLTSNLIHNDGDKSGPLSSVWLKHPQRRSARGTDFNPHRKRYFQDEYGLRWINEFTAPEVVTSDIHPDKFLEHINYLFPIEGEREWFLDWLAYTIRRPANRCKVTPLHVSKAHGTGRGWIVELIHALVGRWNCTKVKTETLMGEGAGGGFHGYLDKTLFCFVEELKEGGKRYDFNNRVRDILTEEHLEVNIKYGGQKTKRIYTHFFLMSNHVDAIILPENDRRINVLSGPDKARSLEYYREIYDWKAQKENVDAVRFWLSTRGLSRFNYQHSFDTPARRKMIDCGTTYTERLFNELRNDPPAMAMTYTQIMDALNQAAIDESGGGIHAEIVDAKQVTKLLQVNCVRTGNIKIKGRPVRPWLFDHSLNGDNEKIRAEVEKCAT